MYINTVNKNKNKENARKKRYCYYFFAGTKLSFPQTYKNVLHKTTSKEKKISFALLTPPTLGVDKRFTKNESNEVPCCVLADKL